MKYAILTRRQVIYMCHKCIIQITDVILKHTSTCHISPTVIHICMCGFVCDSVSQVMIEFECTCHPWCAYADRGCYHTILVCHHETFASNRDIHIANACSMFNGDLKSILKQSSAVFPICSMNIPSASKGSVLTSVPYISPLVSADWRTIDGFDCGK